MSAALLEVRELKKHYVQNNIVSKALDGISLSLHSQEIIGLLGANGAGKTTLSSILATLHPPTAGDVLWQGNSIYTSLSDYRRAIGYCPQRPNLNPHLSLRDNLLFAARFYGLSRKESLARLDEVSASLSLSSFLEAYSPTLSGGWKQRFMIARALMHRPQLLILDEPTVGLDPHIRHQLWDLISTLKGQGLAVLLTTHYLEEAEVLADRVCILDHGLIKLIDKPSNLKTNFASASLEEVFLKLMGEDKT
jgi:ABC-2 type transport system ATP-binding protein